MRAHFVNENISGHATMHLGLRHGLQAYPEVDATFFDCPPRRGLVRLAGARIPGLARLDVDFQPLRAQLARSLVVRRHLNGVESVDVLHLYTQNIALASVDVMRRHPTVVSTDATGAQFSRMHPWRRATRLSPLMAAAYPPLEGRVFSAARLVVTHSAWAARSVSGYGVPEDRIRVIPFGIVVPDPPAPRRPAPRRPAPRPAGAQARITFVGGTMERKGGWRLLDTWRRHFRRDAILTLVTRDPVPPEPGLEVRNDVRPGTAALWEVLAGTTVLALPTDIDTFGYAVLEAMAAGVPVVASRCAAIPELVEEGTTGLLFDVHDDEGLRTALGRVLSEPGLAEGMGRAGRARVEERYDARSTTAQLVEVLAQACALDPIGR